MTARDAWTAVFLLLTCGLPALRLLAPDQQSFAHELVTISGLLATTFLAATMVLPARLRWLTRTLGIESMMFAHRFLGISTALLVLTHIGVIILTDPEKVALLLPMDGVAPPLRAQMATLATVCVVALVLLAANRRGRYEIWRGWHMVLAWIAVVAAGLHITLIGHLIRLDTPDPASSIVLVATGVLVAVLEFWRWVVGPLRSKGAYRVAEVSVVSDSVSMVRVRPARRRTKAPKYRPGQFAWVRLRRTPLFTEEHPFTVSSAVQDSPTIEFTIRHSGDWTRRLRTLRAGDELWLDGPHGSLSAKRNGDGIVLIAGGVGLTPMMSMLRSMMRDRTPGRSVRLILVDRPGQGLFRRELMTMRARLNLLTYELPGRRLTPETLVDCLPPQFLRNRMDYYLCGPPQMVIDGAQSLRELKIPRSRIHTERFEF